MTNLGREVMLVTANCKGRVEDSIQQMKAQLQALEAAGLKNAGPSSAQVGASKFNAAFANKQFEDPMASLNAKMAEMAAQIKDKIRAEEQKLVPFAQAEEELFSKIEDECI
jgi:hypothetical protein